MLLKMSTKLILASFLMAVLPGAMVAAEEAPTTSEQLHSLQEMCAGSAQARSARQEAESLYDRLGGYDRILELTREIVRLHNQNEDIKHMFVDVDAEKLARHVADFMAAGTGGSAKYTGRDMPTAHSHLNLTDADFLSAGGDIVKAMKSMDYGQDEIDEVICILLSLKDQVVFE